MLRFAAATTFTSLALTTFTLPALASTFIVTSPQFQDGEILPQSVVYQGFGCTGSNQSPELIWSNAPAATKSFAVTVYDPDAPTGVGWWHWLIFNLPSDMTRLELGAGNLTESQLPEGIQQGYTDYGSQGYGGPCPPRGDIAHRYIFTVYALDIEHLPIGSEATGAMLSFLIRDHILAEAKIIGYFGR